MADDNKKVHPSMIDEVKPRVSEKYIETSLHSELLDALEKGMRSAYIYGSAGSGKSSLLRWLEQTWNNKTYEAIYIHLRDIEDEREFFSRLNRRSGILADLVTSASFAVVGGGTSSVIGSILQAFSTFKERNFLLLIDGLDEVLSQSIVYRFISRLSDQKNVRFILAGRQPFPSGSLSEHIDRFFEIQPFSKDEITTYLERSHFQLHTDSTPIETLIEVTGGSPLILSLLLKLSGSGELPDLADIGDVRTDLATVVKTLADQTITSVSNRFDSQQILHLLQVIGLLKSVNKSDLSKQYIEIANNLVEQSLLVQENGAYSFVHILFQEHFRRIDQFLHDPISIRKLNFGAEAAENDIVLSDQFMNLPGDEQLFSGQRTIVIGDRGAGKSAYFSSLSQRFENTTAANIKFVTLSNAADLLRNFASAGQPLETAEQFHAAWITLIAYALSREHVASVNPTLRKASKRLSHAVGLHGPPKSGLAAIFGRIFKSSVKIELGPVIIEPQNSPGGAAQTVDLDWFIQQMVDHHALHSEKVVVCFDRIDEVHKYDRVIQETAVQGLFMAEAKLSENDTLSVGVFMRSDLYEIYDLQEKNKLVSRILRLRWSREKLYEFLIRRVSAPAPFENVRALMHAFPRMSNEIGAAIFFPDRIEDKPFENWLWDSLANANDEINPRQLLLLLGLASQHTTIDVVSAKSSSVFSERSILSGMKALSELSFRELLDDFRVAPTFLANCRAGQISVLKTEDIQSLFDEEEGPISKQLHQLERLGFLERVLVEAEDGTQRAELRVPMLFSRGWEPQRL
ncbi:MAG: AAA family ATPase [Bacteroidota bacterium]